MKKTFLLFVFISLHSFAQCWQSISVGKEHSVGVKTDGSLWGWGVNFSGELADLNVNGRNAPTRIGKL
ncbi:hypothetical protein, partial [Chryseobacterium artocarpi]|uniref:hypothetical protein n=1 Tax=Chryseobacterium artocarpi TaxID=1414727 RepID=UPI003F39A960